MGDMAETSPNPMLERHARALELFTDRVCAVRPEQWDAPTPCGDWSVRDLVNHLTVEQMWVPPLVKDGHRVAEVGQVFEGDKLGDDPLGAWEWAADGARKAFGAPGALERTVHLTYGDSSGADYCAEMVADAVVHSWDLARAIGFDERLPEDLVHFAARRVAPHAALLEKSGLFAAAVDPPPGADAQTRLLCLLGRRP
jgi:uncharacterized protein (TIGR03086 family)